VGEQVRLDEELHSLFYEYSGNPLLDRTAEPHWRFLRRAMGEVLRRAELPCEIWRQHEEILEAIVAGNPARAEALIVDHDLHAAETLHGVLSEYEPAASQAL
jgi:DNA-binding GntR family transcriptional regulator